MQQWQTQWLVPIVAVIVVAVTLWEALRARRGGRHSRPIAPTLSGLALGAAVAGGALVRRRPGVGVPLVVFAVACALLLAVVRRGAGDGRGTGR